VVTGRGDPAISTLRPPGYSATRMPGSTRATSRATAAVELDGHPRERDADYS